MDQENIFKTKIKDIEEEIERDAKNLEETSKNISDKKAKIEQLTVLMKRLNKTYRIRHYESLDSVEKIMGLANKIPLSDFMDSLSDVMGFTYNMPISLVPISSLSVWQALYLFHGDFDLIDKEEIPDEAGPGKEPGD